MRYWKGWDAVNCPNQSKHTESWGEKWRGAKPTLTPPVTGKKRCGYHFRAHTAISTISNHSSYLKWDVGRVEMLWDSWIYPKTHNLGMKRRGLEPKSSPPTTQKPGCGDGYTCLIQISTLLNHPLQLQWDIERVEMLWIAPISPNTLNLVVESGEGPSQLWPHRWLESMMWLPF